MNLHLRFRLINQNKDLHLQPRRRRVLRFLESILQEISLTPGHLPGRIRDLCHWRKGLPDRLVVAQGLPPERKSHVPHRGVRNRHLLGTGLRPLRRDQRNHLNPRRDRRDCRGQDLLRNRNALYLDLHRVRKSLRHTRRRSHDRGVGPGRYQKSPGVVLYRRSPEADLCQKSRVVDHYRRNPEVVPCRRNQEVGRDHCLGYRETKRKEVTAEVAHALL